MLYVILTLRIKFKGFEQLEDYIFLKKMKRQKTTFTKHQQLREQNYDFPYFNENLKFKLKLRMSLKKIIRSLNWI